MQRNQLGINLSKLCRTDNFKFERDNDNFYISTAYETFCFEIDEQDLWLSCRKLRGGGPDDVLKINKMLINPAPRKILNAVLEYVSINSDREYVERLYQRIKNQCRENNLRCELKFDKIFIYTMAEEFYFKFSFDHTLNGNFTLMHRGYNGWDKISDEYHRQRKSFNTPYEMVSYIARHTKWKYGVTT